MAHLVTCDEVFDVLTRGPFPTGASEDAEVELHLSGCHECRQLAEALRPASGLLRESLSETRLPAYRGSVGEEPWHEPSGAGKPQQGMWLAQLIRLAAALLLIVSLCAMAGAVSWVRGPTPLTASSLRSQLATSPLTSVCLAALQNPANKTACCTGCHRAAVGPAATSAVATVAKPPQPQACLQQAGNQTGCASCHDVSALARPQAGLGLLAVSCRACHQ